MSMGKSNNWVPAPQIGEMFVATALRQNHKVYAYDLNFFEINFHESFTETVCLESNLVCSFSKAAKK